MRYCFQKATAKSKSELMTGNLQNHAVHTTVVGDNDQQ